MYLRYGIRLRPPTETAQWATVRCFAGTHQDRHPSARVHLRSGGFRCFTCGAAGGALAALELLGVRDPTERVQAAVDHGILDKPVRPRQRPTLIPPPTPPPPVTTPVDYSRVGGAPARERAWVYENHAGEPVGRVKRVDLPTGKKVWQERHDNGQWLPGLDGTQLPLYRLPQVLDHAAAGLQVVVVEGEKACDALDRVGVFATTNAGGAGKWRDDHTVSLHGADVTVICDSDLAGRLHAADVTRSLLDAGATVRMPLDLYDFRNDGSDVVDHLAAITETVRAVQPDVDIDTLRTSLRRNLDREIARQLPAGIAPLQRFVERARYIADPAGYDLVDCGRCGQKRPHRLSHGIKFCPCGHHQPA